MSGNYRLGLILVTASAIAWSTAGLFTRIIPLDAWTILAWRGIFGSLALAVLIVALERGQAWANVKRMGWPGWTFALVSGAGMIMFVTSLRHTTVAHNAVIYATVPFIAAGLAWVVMREKPDSGAIIASLVALSGVAIMVGLGTEGGLLGDVLALGMTISLAVMMVIARRYPDVPVMPAACLSALISALACLPMSNALSVSGYDLAWLAIFGIINSAVGLGLFTLGAKHLPAIETALIGSLDAPLAPLWVWLFFSETPGKATLVGGLIVFVAVVAHVLAGTRKRKAAPVAALRSLAAKARSA